MWEAVRQVGRNLDISSVLPWAEPPLLWPQRGALAPCRDPGQLGWNCATRTAHYGEPSCSTLHRPASVWQEDKSLEMNSQLGHSWTLAVAPAGAMLLSLSYISHGLFSLLESPACQGHSSDTRVQRSGAPQRWGHGRPFLVTHRPCGWHQFTSALLCPGVFNHGNWLTLLRSSQSSPRARPGAGDEDA